MSKRRIYMKKFRRMTPKKKKRDLEIMLRNYLSIVRQKSGAIITIILLVFVITLFVEKIN